MSMHWERAREVPAFRKGDLIVYLLLAAIVGALFFAFFPRKAPPLSGITVLRDDTVLFVYTFGTDRYEAGEGVSVEETETGYRVTIRFGEAENVLAIERSGSAFMLEANCSLHKDCVYMNPITDQNGIIFCVPHHLKICADADAILPPVVG